MLWGWFASAGHDSSEVPLAQPRVEEHVRAVKSPVSIVMWWRSEYRDFDHMYIWNPHSPLVFQEELLLLAAPGRRQVSMMQ